MNGIIANMANDIYTNMIGSEVESIMPDPCVEMNNYTVASDWIIKELSHLLGEEDCKRLADSLIEVIAREDRLYFVSGFMYAVRLSEREVEL